VNGVLVIDKPAGWTSHDVVAKVRGVLGASKVGHLGTLDPAATGVLPLVVGRATRFARWLGMGPKVYEGVIVLGKETDTYDSEGEILREADPGGVTEEEIKKAFEAFRGRIKQVPPMYSAVKRSGTPLYKLARKGITVERPPRDVEIFDIQVLGVSGPEVRFRVSCSAGTYVRSLAYDIGRVLGCGAHLGGLRRMESGVFVLDDAVLPTAGREALEKALIPLGKGLERILPLLDSVELEGKSERDIYLGTRLQAGPVEGFSALHEEGEMLILRVDGRAAALAECLGGRTVKVRWVFGDPVMADA
jgi:tRNA pseudouridine55 synthase